MSVQKRRRQAINRRQWVADMRRRHDYYQDRIAHDATRVSICSCGAKAWTTGDSADADDLEFFDDFDAMHADCGVE